MNTRSQGSASEHGINLVRLEQHADLPQPARHQDFVEVSPLP